MRSVVKPKIIGRKSLPTFVFPTDWYLISYSLMRGTPWPKGKLLKSPCVIPRARSLGREGACREKLGKPHKCDPSVISCSVRVIQCLNKGSDCEKHRTDVNLHFLWTPPSSHDPTTGLRRLSISLSYLSTRHWHTDIQARMSLSVTFHTVAIKLQLLCHHPYPEVRVYRANENCVVHIRRGDSHDAVGAE
jgi:hypothetical protein